MRQSHAWGCLARSVKDQVEGRMVVDGELGCRGSQVRMELGRL